MNKARALVVLYPLLYYLTFVVSVFGIYVEVTSRSPLLVSNVSQHQPTLRIMRTVDGVVHASPGRAVGCSNPRPELLLSTASRSSRTF
jgi:hypothetical protein